MTIIEPGSARAGLVARVKSLLLQPSATWDDVDREPATVGGLMTGYVMILAAIPAICGTIGMVVFGVGAFGFNYRPPLVWALGQGILGYALSLGMVFVMALIIDGLAPSFGGTKDRIQAFKLAAYAPTASWVAGVFGLLPSLAVVALLGGLYSLYILFRGLPKLMKVPQERAGGYFAVVLVIAIVVSFVIAMITSSLMSMSRMAGGGLGGAPMAGTVKVPGQGEVDLAKLEAASKAIEAASKQMESGEGPAPTDPDILKAYLPASLGGFNRTEVSSSTGGMGGIQGSGSEGRYEKGEARLTLRVVDLGSAGALAAMAGAFNVKSSKETASGYEKIGKVDGRLTQESYDKSSRHGEYSVLVADRFMIQAEGDGVGVDELKSAVNAVGVSRLEGLAKGG